jgi:hypothetical protein
MGNALEAQRHMMMADLARLDAALCGKLGGDRRAIANDPLHASISAATDIVEVSNNIERMRAVMKTLIEQAVMRGLPSPPAEWRRPQA